jgi:hypothetical protein
MQNKKMELFNYLSINDNHNNNTKEKKREENVS